MRCADIDREGAGPSGQQGPPLSVAFYCPGWPPEAVANGIVMYVRDITSGLRELGHRPCILAGNTEGDQPYPDVEDLRRWGEGRGIFSRLIDKGMHRLSPDGSLDDRACRPIERAVRHAATHRGLQLLEMEETFGWALRVRRRVPVPVVVRLHGPWFLNGPANGAKWDAATRRRVRLEGQAIAAADAVTASSADVLEQTRSYYHLPLTDAVVIHPPIPPVAPGDRWHLESCEPGRILFVGRFDKHKGGDVILEAFGRVAERHPTATLLFAGPDRGVVDDDGRSWTFGEYLRSRLPGAIAGRVRYLGQVPVTELPELRRSAFATVVASRYDNFPTTVMEALSRGCPLIATRIGGIPEVVEDGVSGLLCRPGDVADLAEKLSRLLDDPALAGRLGGRAAELCASRLDPVDLAGQMTDVYRRAISRRGA